MKKLLILLLSLLLVFSLVACGNDDSPNNDDPLNRDPDTSQTDSQGGQDDPVNVEDIDFGAMMGGNASSDTVYGKMDEATKQQLIDEAKKEGIDITFGADGSMTITDETGLVVKQNPDGTWEIQNGAGVEGTAWPDNKFTKLISKPSFTYMIMSADEYGMEITSTTATIEQLRDYAEGAKNAGFTQNAMELDQEGIYNYTAYNSDGYKLTINQISGVTGIGLLAPQGDNGGENDSGDEPTSSTWANNAYTKLLPEPSFEYTIIDTGNGVTVASTTGTIEQLRDYTAQAKSAGFNQNETVVDQEMGGYTTYMFSASNAAGYSVQIRCIGGNISISIYK